MKKKRALLLLALFLVGLGLGSVLDRFRPDEPDVVPDEPVARTAITHSDNDQQQLERLLAASRARVKELESELEQVRGALASTQPAEAEEPEESARDRFEERIRQRIEERIDGRIEQMATTYGLNDAQKAALQDVFRQRMENFRARRNGEDVPSFNLDEAIGKVLNEAQFAKYLEDSQEEIYNRAELIATNQTVRMAQSISMDPAVQDLVYETVHLTAQEMMIARQAGADFSMRSVLDQRLSSILTEEQMNSYRESTASSGFGPGGGGGLGPGGGGYGP